MSNSKYLKKYVIPAIITAVVGVGLTFAFTYDNESPEPDLPITAIL